MSADTTLPTVSRTAELFDLLDWKRQIFGLYEEVRAASGPEAAWTRWRELRDELFRHHPQSPFQRRLETVSTVSTSTRTTRLCAFSPASWQSTPNLPESERAVD